MLTFFLICFGAGIIPYLYYLIKIFKNKKNTPHISSFYPHISVVINVYKEDFQKRLLNLLETSYPKDKISVYVVNDGSEDTVIINDAEVLTFKERMGKNASINYMLNYVDSDIVVFTDADVENDYYTLEELISPFSDEHVGAVCADVIVKGKPNVTTGNETAYRSIYGKMCEVDGDNVRNFNGQMLACRKSAVPQISEYGADDANIAVESHKNGYATKYVSSAHVYESQPLDLLSQFKQKTRRAKGLLISLSLDEKYCLSLLMRIWMLALSPVLFVMSFIIGCFIAPPYSALLLFVFLLVSCICYKTMIGSFVFNQIYLFCGLCFTRYSGKWDVVKK